MSCWLPRPETSLTLDVERLRERFPTLAHKIYLNSGSYGLLARDVRRAFEDYLTGREERGSDWGEWTARSEAVRTHIARVLNAAPDEMAVTATSSAGIELILDLGVDAIESHIRVMFHCYNNQADVDALVGALLANRALLK